MSAITRFRERLAADETCIGASITFTDPRVTDALADSVDFFWIDLDQIETAEAFAALDDILAIPGLDSLVLGPQDLSGALGGWAMSNIRRW